MRLSKNDLYIGLGSNLGDSLANLAMAVALLEKHFNVQAVLSGIYRSEPVEYLDQPWFYNQVALLRPAPPITPLHCLEILKNIERQMGRKPGPRYGPRPIDLDLLFYRDWIFESASLTVPHPKIEERSFVLLPLIEINPDLVNPRDGKVLAEIYAAKRDHLSICQKIN